MIPETLDETYDRILTKIPSEHRAEAYKALQFIAVSACQVSIADVAESLAVDQQDHTFKDQNRLSDPLDILEICSSLVTYSTSQTVLHRSATSVRWQGAEIATEVRLAHYSVKEYLLSNRILNGSASNFHILEPEAHEFVGEVCLTYLISYGNRRLSEQSFIAFPLLRYAAQYWPEHVRIASQNTDRHTLTQLSLLLLDNSSVFTNWLRIYDPDYYRGISDIEKIFLQVPSATYNASHRDLTQVTRRLLGTGASANKTSSEGNTALGAASFYGHTEVMELLLDYGADPDPNAEITHGRTKSYGRTALHIAAYRGSKRAVELLLSYKSNIEAKTCPVFAVNNPLSLLDADMKYPEHMMNSTLPPDLGDDGIFQKLLDRFVENHLFLCHRPRSEFSTFDGRNVLRNHFFSGHSVELESCTGWVPLHEASIAGNMTWRSFRFS